MSKKVMTDMGHRSESKLRIKQLLTLASDSRLLDIDVSGARCLSRLAREKRLVKLEKLSKRARFNVFYAMGTADYEIRHSNFIAFFLNPKERHGLGTLFYEIFCEHPKIRINLKQAPKDNELAVSRELEHTDIDIVDETNGIGIVIENKLYSAESLGQLSRYWSRASQRHGLKRPYFFYLSLDEKSEISDSRWRPITYAVIRDVVRKILRRKSLGASIRFSLEQYVDLIESKL